MSDAPHMPPHHPPPPNLTLPGQGGAASTLPERGKLAYTVAVNGVTTEYPSADRAQYAVNKEIHTAGPGFYLSVTVTPATGG